MALVDVKNSDSFPQASFTMMRQTQDSQQLTEAAESEDTQNENIDLNAQSKSSTTRKEKILMRKPQVRFEQKGTALGRGNSISSSPMRKILGVKELEKENGCLKNQTNESLGKTSSKVDALTDAIATENAPKEFTFDTEITDTMVTFPKPEAFSFDIGSGFQSKDDLLKNIGMPSLDFYEKITSKRINTPKSVRRKVRLREYRRKKNKEDLISKQKKRKTYSHLDMAINHRQRNLFPDDGSNDSPYSTFRTSFNGFNVDASSNEMTAKTMIFWICLFTVFLLALFYPQALRNRLFLLHDLIMVGKHDGDYTEIDIRQALEEHTYRPIEPVADDSYASSAGIFSNIAKTAVPKGRIESNSQSRKDLDAPPSIAIVMPQEDGQMVTQGNLLLSILVKNVFPELYKIHRDPRVCLSVTSETTGISVAVGCYETKVGVLSEVTLRNIKPDHLTVHATLVSKAKKLARTDRKIHVESFSISNENTKGTLNDLEYTTFTKHEDGEQVCETQCTRTCKFV